METETKVHFIFDKDNLKKRLKWKDVKLVQKLGKEIKLSDEGVLDKIQTIACRFMVDEANQYIPFAQAYEIFDELSQEEAEDVLTKFAEAMQETAVPKVNATNSTSPSSVNSAVTSPDGSQP